MYAKSQSQSARVVDGEEGSSRPALHAFDPPGTSLPSSFPLPLTLSLALLWHNPAACVGVLFLCQSAHTQFACSAGGLIIAAHNNHSSIRLSLFWLTRDWCFHFALTARGKKETERRQAERRKEGQRAQTAIGRRNKGGWGEWNRIVGSSRVWE